MDMEPQQFFDGVAQAVSSAQRHQARQSLSLEPADPDIEDYKLMHRINDKPRHSQTPEQNFFAEALRQRANSDPYYADLSAKAQRELECKAIEGRLAEAREKRAAYGDSVASDWGLPADVLNSLPSLEITNDWKLGQYREKYGPLTIAGALQDVREVRALDAEISKLESELHQVLPPARKIQSERDKRLAAAKVERQRRTPAKAR